MCVGGVPHLRAAYYGWRDYQRGLRSDVARDMEVALDWMIPQKGDYRHAEGNSDSHIKAALVGTSESVFIEHRRLALGRWQAIFFCEFDGPRYRDVRVKIVAD
jgi:secondary thiamine-phosphate synthase enzyme